MVAKSPDTNLSQANSEVYIKEEVEKFLRDEDISTELQSELGQLPKNQQSKLLKMLDKVNIPALASDPACGPG